VPSSPDPLVAQRAGTFAAEAFSKTVRTFAESRAIVLNSSVGSNMGPLKQFWIHVSMTG